MIQFHYEDTGTELPNFRLPCEEEVAEWLGDIAARYDCVIGHLNYIFSDDEYVLYLNQKYLKHDYYTDILTFDYTADDPEGTPLVVDIFISIDRVIENARNLHLSFLDELHRVMVHGLLHTIGFDDHSPEDQAEMRKQEDIALALRMF